MEKEVVLTRIKMSVNDYTLCTVNIIHQAPLS